MTPVSFSYLVCDRTKLNPQELAFFCHAVFLNVWEILDLFVHCVISLLFRPHTLSHFSVSQILLSLKTVMFIFVWTFFLNINQLRMWGHVCPCLFHIVSGTKPLDSLFYLALETFTKVRYNQVRCNVIGSFQVLQHNMIRYKVYSFLHKLTYVLVK